MTRVSTPRALLSVLLSIVLVFGFLPVAPAYAVGAETGSTTETTDSSTSTESNESAGSSGITDSGTTDPETGTGDGSTESGGNETTEPGTGSTNPDTGMDSETTTPDESEPTQTTEPDGTAANPYQVGDEQALRDTLSTAADGSYIKITADIPLANHIEINKSVTIDGAKADNTGNYTISNKIVYVSGSDKAITFNNLDFVRTGDVGNTIVVVGRNLGETAASAPDVTFDNCNLSINTNATTTMGALAFAGGVVTLNDSTITNLNGAYASGVADSYNSYAIRMTGYANTSDLTSGISRQLNLNNTDVTVASNGKAIYVDNGTRPGDTITIEGGAISGWGALAMHGQGVKTTFNNVNISSVNPHKSGAQNNYSAITFHTSATSNTVEVIGGSVSTVASAPISDTNQYIGQFYNTNNTLKFSGTTLTSENNQSEAFFTYSSSYDPDDEFFQYRPAGGVSPISLENVTCNGSTIENSGNFVNIYNSAARAIDAAQEGNTVILGEDLTTQIPANKNITIDANNYQVSAAPATDAVYVYDQNDTFASVPVDELNQHVSINTFGFKAAADSANSAINTAIENVTGEQGAVSDSATNTAYAVLSNRLQSEQLSIQFTNQEGTAIYTEPWTADARYIATYFTFTPNAGSSALVSVPAGDYTAKLLNNGTETGVEAALSIYEVKTNVDGTETSLGYAMLGDAEALIQAADEPSKEGFTFTGWSTANTNEETNTITYTAQWQANSLEVLADTFSTPGTTGIPESVFTYGSIIYVEGSVEYLDSVASNARVTLTYNGEALTDVEAANVNTANPNFSFAYNTANQDIPVSEGQALTITVSTDDGTEIGSSTISDIALNAKSVTAVLSGDAGKRYDGNNTVPAVTDTDTGDVNDLVLSLESGDVLEGDIVTVEAKGGYEFGGTTVGTKTVSATGLTLDGEDSAFYALNLDSATLNDLSTGITGLPANLTSNPTATAVVGQDAVINFTYDGDGDVSASAVSTEGGDVPAEDIVISAINPDDNSGTVTISNLAAGSYTVTLSATEGDTSLAAGPVEVTLTVLEETPEVTVTVDTYADEAAQTAQNAFTYGDVIYVSGSVNGLVEDATVSLTYNGQALTGVDPITVTADNPNFTFAYNTANKDLLPGDNTYSFEVDVETTVGSVTPGEVTDVTLAKKQLSVDFASDYTRQYDGTTDFDKREVTATINGVVGDDRLAIDLTDVTFAFESANAGTTNVLVTGAEDMVLMGSIDSIPYYDGAVTPTYTEFTVDGEGITPASPEVVVTAPQDPVYVGDTATLTHNYPGEAAAVVVVTDQAGEPVSGFIAEETEGAVSISGLPAGTYTVTLEFAAQGNYGAVSGSTTLTVAVSPDTSNECNVYRLYNPNTGMHHYTIDENEYNVLQGVGWTGEGMVFVMLDASVEGADPVYRAYNPNNGTHNWTLDANEQNTLVSLGWENEGVAWRVPAYAETPVYRLYNPTSHEHLYTTDENEYNVLQNVGWNGEGVGWMSV